MKVTMKLASALALAGAVFGTASAAFAADVYQAPLEAAAAAPAPAPSPTWTIGFEASPEWKISDGTFADWYFKGSLSHSFGGGWSVGVAFQDTVKVNSTYQYFIEATLGYKVKFGDFSLTPSVLLGDTWGATGFGGGTAASLYYAIALAGDWKLSKHWTWNVFNVRYRNAFSYAWVTPKVSTGLTYNIDSTNSVYTSIGYGWKNGVADKFNWAVGYKHAF
jgi:hypothetical protein